MQRSEVSNLFVIEIFLIKNSGNDAKIRENYKNNT